MPKVTQPVAEPSCSPSSAALMEGKTLVFNDSGVSYKSTFLMVRTCSFKKNISTFSFDKGRNDPERIKHFFKPLVAKLHQIPKPSGC